MADRHRSAVPEVTFCGLPIAVGSSGGQHAAMPYFLRRWMSPLTLAGVFTILAVGLSFGFSSDPGVLLRWGMLGLFLMLFLLHDLLPARSPWGLPLDVVQAGVALALLWLAPRTGTAPVLLVVLVAHLASHWSLRQVLVAAVLLDLCMYLILQRHGLSQALLIVGVYGGFQAFAALCAHYARSAEEARDALARSNADLLATRTLLEDTTRDAERLRLARDLHDVAGHKLTAMRINLRALAAQPELASCEPLQVAERLSAELLGDIRQVVQRMRDDEGLDLATALQALAAPFPRPLLQVGIDEGVRVADARVAEVLLRLAQEALTNAARHGNADTVWLQLSQEHGELRVDIRDDGQRSERIIEGNGIAGMRERLALLQGRLQLARSPQGGMHLIAWLPA